MAHPWAMLSTLIIFYLAFGGFMASMLRMTLRDYLIAILIPPAIIGMAIPIATWIAIGKFQFGL